MRTYKVWLAEKPQFDESRELIVIPNMTDDDVDDVGEESILSIKRREALPQTASGVKTGRHGQQVIEEHNFPLSQVHRWSFTTDGGDVSDVQPGK